MERNRAATYPGAKDVALVSQIHQHKEDSLLCYL